MVQIPSKSITLAAFLKLPETKPAREYIDGQQTKVTKNLLHCIRHGAEMGWLIDPDEQTVFVYLPQQQFAIFDQPEQPLPVPAFANELTLTVGSIFNWLWE